MIELDRDKDRYLRGTAIYTDDIKPDRLTYGIAIRSRESCGEIKSVTVRSLPGGYSLIDHTMVPGKNIIKFPDGEMPFLAEKEVRFAGQPIYLLSGPERRLLGTLQTGIEIKYSLRNAAFFMDEINALKTIEFKIVRGDVSEAFSVPEATVLSKTYTTRYQEHFPAETHSTLCEWDEKSGTMTVWVSSTYPYHVRESVARLLGVPEKCVRVIVPDSGDSCHGKLYYPSIVAGHAALVSFLTGTPCKIVYSRTDDLLHSFKRPPTKITLCTATDPKGKLLGLKAEITVDCGAYRVCPRLELERIIITLLSSYQCEHVEIVAYTSMTNKLPSGPFSGLGEPQGTFALELHATSLAHRAQTDPCQWRKENMRNFGRSLQRGGQSGAPLDSVLDGAIRRSDFSRKYAAYEALNKRSTHSFSPRSFLRGIGIAFSLHGNGLPGAHEQEFVGHSVRVALDKDGTVRVFTSLVDAGSNKEALFSAIASKVLGVPQSKVFLEHVDTQIAPDSGPPVCSRTIILVGHAIEQCCVAIRQKTEKGAVEADISKKVLAQSKETWDQERFTGSPYHTMSREGTVVEVEIDPITLEVFCRGIWIVIDAGEIILPELARLHVEKAAFQNLGFAAMELLPVENGRIGSRALSEYNIPGVKDQPRIDVAFIDDAKGKKHNAALGLGDQAVTGVAPAYVAAVDQALGREFTGIPLTAEIIQAEGAEE